MAQPQPLMGILGAVAGARLVSGTLDGSISAVEHDSRKVIPGTLFIAVPGFTTDGHQFLPEAIAAGAGAIMVEESRRPIWEVLSLGVPTFVVPDCRVAMSAAAAWFYRYPSRGMTVVGITGTDGKTTTSHLLTSVLEAAGRKVGRLGTVDTYMPGASGKVSQRMSTPEAPEVQALLRQMVDAGCDAAIVESTSHGLALHRLDHVEYDVAMMTNITGDHLDFHQTFEAYREAKAALFAALDAHPAKTSPRTAIVNLDDPSANYMLAKTMAPSFTFALDTPADVTAADVRLTASGSGFRLMTPIGQAGVHIGLPARFNVANALAAAAAGIACGATVPGIVRGLRESKGVPGRMERIEAGQPFEVIVDYAHTGDAVRKVLEVLRSVGSGKLMIVVGAAGDRDPGRRFGVARAAAEGADFAIFTNEDPRNEDPAAIVREIGRHAEDAGRRRGEDFIEIEDRREAIREALRRAQPGDIVVVAGKGHEQTIIYGSVAHPWDDRSVTREALAELGYGGS
ncbi:MAG: UDP-N-acetylmuramoyl-L-alanyl-D-glutamate--2,6-diaminopimelate ligase [Dehalococcoidia bacterium]